MKIVSLDKIDLTEVSHNPNVKKQIMLENGELPMITNFSCATFPPGEAAPAHHHVDMGEVFFILSGNGIICVNEIEHTLKQGTCVVVEAGEEHEIRNTGSDDLVVIYFGVQL